MHFFSFRTADIDFDHVTHNVMHHRVDNVAGEFPLAALTAEGSVTRGEWGAVQQAHPARTIETG